MNHGSLGWYGSLYLINPPYMACTHGTEWCPKLVEIKVHEEDFKYEVQEEVCRKCAISVFGSEKSLDEAVRQAYEGTMISKGDGTL